MADKYKTVKMSLQIPRKSLNLYCMLLGGQSFRWKERKADSFIGVIRNNIVEIDQTEECCHFKFHQTLDSRNTNNSYDSLHKMIKDYLQLEFPIEKYYKMWSEMDSKHFRSKAELLPGIRMLRQDPFENVMSFICSQNNHISRISQLVEKLCINFGTFIATFDDEDFYAFPTLKELSEASDLEGQLRKLSFGYRAGYISKAVKFLSNEPENWLENLRDVEYHEAKEQLIRIPGVGPKVADCICLMSLDKTNSVPVDTHVLQIAMRDYKIPQFQKNKSQKLSLSAHNYNIISSFFQNLFLDYAGWAHTILFCSDLKTVPGKRKSGELEDISNTTDDFPSTESIKLSKLG